MLDVSGLFYLGRKGRERDMSRFGTQHNSRNRISNASPWSSLWSNAPTNLDIARDLKKNVLTPTLSEWTRESILVQVIF